MRKQCSSGHEAGTMDAWMNLTPRTTTRYLWPTVFCLLSTAYCPPARAQMPLHPPEIRTIFPIGGVQGSTVELLVDGQNVSDPSAVAVSGEGIHASVIAEETS